MLFCAPSNPTTVADADTKDYNSDPGKYCSNHGHPDAISPGDLQTAIGVVFGLVPGKVDDSNVNTELDGGEDRRDNGHEEAEDGSYLGG